MSAQIGLLLRMYPLSLEKRFWDAPETRFKLYVLDVVAFAMVVPNLATAVLGRIKPALPQGVQLPWGARVMLILYWMLCMLPVLVMLTSRKTYRRWRQWLVCINRMYRVGAAMALTHPATVLGYVTQVTAVHQATAQGHIWKALLTNTLMPTVWHMQHSHNHLPFRMVIPFQLTTYVIAILWAQGMPCWLPVPLTSLASTTNASSPINTRTTTSSSSNSWPTSPYQQQCPAPLLAPSSNASMSTVAGLLEGPGVSVAAISTAAGAAGSIPPAAMQALQSTGSGVCEALQVFHALFWSVIVSNLGDGNILLTSQALCTGVTAFQVLYLFVAAVLLLITPLVSVCVLEYFAKLQWLRANRITVTGQSLVSNDGGSNAGRCSGWVRPGAQFVPWSIMVVLCIGGPWKLAELLTTATGGVCAPPLGSSAFAWMASLF